MVSSVENKAQQLRRNKRRVYKQSKMSKGLSPRVSRRATPLTMEKAVAMVENARERSKRGNEAKRQKRKKWVKTCLPYEYTIRCGVLPLQAWTN